jgi:hypothetical protein
MLSFKTRNQLFRTKTYWLSKKWVQEKPVFWFLRSAFSSQYKFGSVKNSFKLVLPTFPSFIRTILSAALIVSFFEAFNIFFPVPDSLKFDVNAIDTLLAAIASISGVFLGLYFTAISGIASSLLIKAKQDVRDFFLSSPIGLQYVKTVAMTGIVSIFYIVSKSFGHTIHPASLAFLCLLSTYIIFRFWSISSNIFNSLEPRSSFPWITKYIADSITGVVPPGFQWNKPLIQNHHRLLVSRKLELVNNLIDFGVKEIELPDEELTLAIRHLCGLLDFYSEKKRKVPSQSFWYKTKNQFQSWGFANSTNISIALETGTSIRPKEVKDVTWFEEQIFDIIKKIFVFLVKRKSTLHISQGLDALAEIAEIYAKDLDVDALRLLFDKTKNVTNADTTDKEEDSKEQLALVDSQGVLATSALLGFMKILDAKPSERISQAITNIDWTSDKAHIYLSDLPQATVARLEQISHDLKNELEIEGRRIGTLKRYIHNSTFLPFKTILII